jgi:hypothetical protein
MHLGTAFLGFEAQGKHGQLLIVVGEMFFMNNIFYLHGCFTEA